MIAFLFSSRRRHTRFDCDWSSDVCSSDLLINGGPGADIAPAYLRGNHEHTRRPFDTRSGLENSIVHGDVLELRIDGAQLTFVATRSNKFCEPFQSGVRLRQKTLQILQERGGPPEKHSGVPVIISGSSVRSEEHTSELQSQSNLVCRLLLEKKKKNIQQ